MQGIQRFIALYLTILIRMHAENEHVSTVYKKKHYSKSFSVMHIEDGYIYIYRMRKDHYPDLEYSAYRDSLLTA